jgi:hypothetical protein
MSKKSDTSWAMITLMRVHLQGKLHKYSNRPTCNSKGFPGYLVWSHPGRHQISPLQKIFFAPLVRRSVSSKFHSWQSLQNRIDLWIDPIQKYLELMLNTGKRATSRADMKKQNLTLRCV